MNAERRTLAYRLGFAGTLPFLWGAVTQFVQIPLSANLLGAQLQLTYGIVIFAYMSGTHWNFAARYQQGESPVAYIFAVLPALLPARAGALVELSHTGSEVRVLRNLPDQEWIAFSATGILQASKRATESI